MPRFRYEAVDRSGIPIHGSIEAESESALIDYLSTRRQKLVSASELSLDALIAANTKTLPRLYQLRIGEQLREAVLTGLPAHHAVRAIAAEPLSHPIPDLAPWLQAAALLVFAVTAFGWWLSESFRNVALGVGIIAFVVVPLIWAALLWRYRFRPRRLLQMLADRLEAGESIPASLSHAMPSELQSVMNSSLDDSSKARVAADLVPNLQGNSLNSQQFVLTLIGPLSLLGLVIFGLHGALLYVVAPFKEIFDDFGTQLPWMTSRLVELAQMTVLFGTTGWLLTGAVVLTGLGLLGIVVTSGWASEALSKVPGVGLSFRWKMQARVARVLSSLIRNDCPYPLALKTATAGSGFESVEEQGFMLAKELESNSGQTFPIQQLSGLPISMLATGDGGQHDDERKAAIADTFQSLSEMMDSASVGHGRLLAVFLQFFTVLLSGLLVFIGVVAMFLPLIKLLNDLS